MLSSLSRGALTRITIAVLIGCLAVSVAALASPSEARGTRHCSDFANQQAAQLFWIKYDGDRKLVQSMDDDHDGLACEKNAGPRYTRTQLPSVYRHLLARRTKGSITLNSVGSRYPNKAIQIKGYVSGTARGSHKVVLQKREVGSENWVSRGTRWVRNGSYQFANQTSSKVGIVRFRTLLYVSGKVADTSNVIMVRIIRTPGVPPSCATRPNPTTCASTKPLPNVEMRTIDVPPVDCTTYTMQTADQTRNQPYVWSKATKGWVPGTWSDWATVATGSRTATLVECPGGPTGPQPDALLPDVRIRAVTTCSQSEQNSTPLGSCFKIIYPTDGPAAGHKFLKFPVSTLNVGDGPAELNATRPSITSTNESDWTANQTIYNADGSTSVIPATDVGFYYAGDGHNHWHVRDFDDYYLLNASGTKVATAEKHGYCLEDNTTYGPFQGQPGVPANPAYEHAHSCGLGEPDALDITHGLSKGWGDTYPSTLPDQGIVIDGLPNGVYNLVVHADQADAVIESDEDNNFSVVQIRITGNTVEPLGVATGL